MTSLLGVNFSIDHTPDVDARSKFHNALAPTYSVAMVDAAKDAFRIRDVEAMYPDSIIIGRIWHKMQGGFHLKPTGAGDENKEFVASPEDIANQMDETGYKLGIDGKSWAYVLNEPMGNATDASGEANLDRLFRWYSRWMDKSIVQKRRSVMFNWADREPAIFNGMWHERWHGLLKRMALYPELFMVGMHFYGPDKLTGSLEAYVATCKHLTITPLKVIGTEFGVDTDAGSATNGYHSRGWTGEQMGQWVEAAVRVDLAPYFMSGVLAGLTLFTWSAQPDWSAFDISRDDGLKNYLLDAKKRGIFDTPTPKRITTTIPIIHPFPIDFATRSKEMMVKATLTQFIRLDPIRGAIGNGPITSKSVRCDVILPDGLRQDEVYTDIINGLSGQWLPIKCEGHQGWVFNSTLTFSPIPDKVVTVEVPVVDSAPKTELPLPIIPVKTKRQIVLEYEATDAQDLLIKPTADQLATAFRAFLQAVATQ